MNIKLKHCQEITEKRDFGKSIVSQSLVITIDYDPAENSIEDARVDLYENGTHVAEISKLLDKVEGNPLTEMIQAIDWNMIYKQQEMEVEL